MKLLHNDSLSHVGLGIIGGAPGDPSCPLSANMDNGGGTFGETGSGSMEIYYGERIEVTGSRSCSDAVADAALTAGQTGIGLAMLGTLLSTLPIPALKATGPSVRIGGSSVAGLGALTSFADEYCM